MRTFLLKAVRYVVTAFFIGAAFSGGYLTVQHLDHQGDPGASAPMTPVKLATGKLIQSGPGLAQNTIPELVKKASPAVVKINTVIRNGSSSSQQSPFFPFQPYNPQPQVEYGIGSGVIISADGYILTNDHVIHGANSITVNVVGYNKPFPATVVGSDYALDLAVLKITAPKALPTLPLAPSKDIQVGQWVVAIGNPYGLKHTVTVGVISAEGRPLTIGNRQYKNLLQTDAAINPGNSGGPLLNLSGQVVGLNTAVSTRAQGIGFAIPMSTVRSVLHQLITRGYVIRPWLGVEIEDLTPPLAQYLNVPVHSGAVIAYVYPGSPASKAGLRPGDVVTAVGSKAIKTAQALVNTTEADKVGTKIKITYYSGPTKKTVSVTLAQKPQNLPNPPQG